MSDPEQRYQTIIEKLRQNRHKITPQRMAIARILGESRGHPGVEEIYDRLKKDYPTMSLATVYRTVMVIKSLGEVLELGFPDGGNRYDGNRPYPHPHLVCVKCRKIIDPGLDTLKGLASRVSAETGFQILSHRLDFFGICEECDGSE